RLHRDEDSDPDQHSHHHDGPLHIHAESDAETLVAAAEEDPHIAEAGRDWDSHCIGNGADGYRVELIYMRPQGAAGTYEAQVEAIRNYAYDASEIFHDSASKTG